MEAQTFFGVAAPIYPTHKSLSTQRFVGIVVTNYQQFSPIWGPPPWSSISLLLVRESRLCCACLVGAILLCAYLMEHEGFEPSCRALPNAGVNTRSDLLCPRKEGGPLATHPGFTISRGFSLPLRWNTWPKPCPSRIFIWLRTQESNLIDRLMRPIR